MNTLFLSTLKLVVKFLPCFTQLTKHNISQPYIPQEDFGTKTSTGDENAVGYDLYVFDLCYENAFSFPQFTNVQFKLADVVRKFEVIGCLVILTNNQLTDQLLTDQLVLMEKKQFDVI